MKNRSRKTKKRESGIIFILLLLLLYISNTQYVYQLETNPPKDTSIFSSLTPHASITITLNSDFVSLGFSGNGVFDDPYRIEGYNITTTDSYGIRIQDVTSYFRISDCLIDATDSGIYIENVINGRIDIENNTCINNLYGIRLISCIGGNLSSNVCNYNNDGIYLLDTLEMDILNNTCFANNHQGIYVSSSMNNTLYMNECHYSNYGIEIINSQNNNITQNKVYDNNFGGINLVRATNHMINNNTVYNSMSGISSTESSASIINNTCYDQWTNIYSSKSVVNVSSNLLYNGDYGVLLWNVNQSYFIL